MSVTKSTAADVLALTWLVNTAYRGDESKKGWTTEAHLLSGNRIDQETMSAFLADPEITILKYKNNAGQITGCVYLEKKTGHLYLGMLSVLPQLQNSGIGRQLLLAAEMFAADINLLIIKMTVISTRTELITWYKRRGYIETGEILPFHIPEKFGIPNTHIELLVLEKALNA